MNITKKILTVLKESYKKKSLIHLYDSLWLFIYSILKFKSLDTTGNAIISSTLVL